MGARLLYITTNVQGSGGVSRILSVKLNYLIEKFGYEIYVLNSNSCQGGFFYTFNKEITFYHLKKTQSKLFTLFSFKRELIKILKDINPVAVVNCDNGLKGSLVPFFLNKKVPLVYERHCNRFIRGESLIENLKLKLSNFLIDKSINKYARFIVTNKYSLKDWKGGNRQVINNPLWFDLPKSLSSLDNKSVIAVGRYAFEKQYDVLIKIWKAVIVENPEWVLKIYGEKKDSDYFNELTKNVQDLDNIEFCDPISNIEQIYLNASLLLNTSSSEEFGLAIMEGMAFGLPVVAFDNNLGPKMLIENNVNGFLIQRNDLNRYIKIVNSLLSDSELRQKIGSQGRNSVAKYNLEGIMERWHDLFTTI